MQWEGIFLLGPRRSPDTWTLKKDQNRSRVTEIRGFAVDPGAGVRGGVRPLSPQTSQRLHARILAPSAPALDLKWARLLVVESRHGRDERPAGFHGPGAGVAAEPQPQPTVRGRAWAPRLSCRGLGKGRSRTPVMSANPGPPP